MSFARNSITDPVHATIENVPLLTTARGDVSVTATENATIDAISAAAAVSLAFGGSNSVAIAGGGALAANFIEAATQSDIVNSTLGDANHPVGGVTVTAANSSRIEATIAAAAASVAIGGQNATAVAIGLALAYNQIGDASGFGAGVVKADITNSSITGTGLVDVEAKSDGVIASNTVAAAAAVSGGGQSGVGVAGGGVGVFNTIAVGVSATIDGGGTDSIAADGVTVAASDTAKISALAAAAALSAAFGGTNGVAVSIGVSIAGNIINDPVTCFITGLSGLTTSAATPATYRTSADTGGVTELRSLQAGDTVQLSDGSGAAPAYGTVTDVFGANRRRRSSIPATSCRTARASTATSVLRADVQPQRIADSGALHVAKWRPEPQRAANWPKTTRPSTATSARRARSISGPPALRTGRCGRASARRRTTPTRAEPTLLRPASWSPPATETSIATSGRPAP